jgi:hypothetical protein
LADYYFSHKQYLKHPLSTNLAAHKCTFGIPVNL